MRLLKAGLLESCRCDVTNDDEDISDDVWVSTSDESLGLYLILLMQWIQLGASCERRRAVMPWGWPHWPERINRQIFSNFISLLLNTITLKTVYYNLISDAF